MAATPTLAEDLLLLLFDPRSGTIAGEGTLFYTLGGAILAELARSGKVTVEGRRVATADTTPPADPFLAEQWERIGARPRSVQTVIAEVGPRLRAPVLDRLVERGDIRLTAISRG
ncbi:GPP34 family phosphoprotein [Rhodococcus rhodnii]|uniref:GPP34 family phosphoprotein n=2 Tax=Rhodococcus rhodnii TaxID=38312 RepID=R7WQE1_9NOCA|nr:GPP34 family phosphoprotein [Rhodococcus rhodnii]EOM77523.1 hypothetical protein Rrhod_1112 [Rhodococcus rhodnii LMG 5362]TXG90722.1 GPP34 family phosphoprotein [Rhodococcus rhodnii]